MEAPFPRSNLFSPRIFGDMRALGNGSGALAQPQSGWRYAVRNFSATRSISSWLRCGGSPS